MDNEVTPVTPETPETPAAETPSEAPAGLDVSALANMKAEFDRLKDFEATYKAKEQELNTWLSGFSGASVEASRITTPAQQPSTFTFNAPVEAPDIDDLDFGLR